LNEHLRLVKPTTDLEEEYLDFYHEWKSNGGDMIPWVIKKDPNPFSKMVDSLLLAEKGENLPNGWVPDSTYWLVSGSDRILGVVNIRHSLTEKLSQNGGHIGYGIRPSERRKGFATKLLTLSLQKAQSIGIDQVLIVCDAWNKPSERTILSADPVRDEDFIEEDGNVIFRYWVDTKGRNWE
jgi:predicted acetyltransferase